HQATRTRHVTLLRCNILASLLHSQYAASSTDADARLPGSGAPLAHQSLQFRVATLSQHDADMGVEISMASRLLRQAPALQPQHLVGTRPWRHVDGQPACRRLHSHFCAKDRIMERYRQIGMEVAAFDT